VTRVSTTIVNGSSSRIHPVVGTEAKDGHIKDNRLTVRKRTKRNIRQHNCQQSQVDKKHRQLTENADTATVTGSNGLSADDCLAIYFREMGQVALLSPTEEVELARRIEKGHRAELKLAAGTRNAAEARNLIVYIEAGLQARDHLIRANTRLVISIAKRYTRLGLPLADLIQEGNLGLIRAVEKSDHRLGFKFSTYASWWIRQAISRALANQGRNIRLPVYFSDQVYKLNRVSEALQQSLGRQPTAEEMAVDMGLTGPQVQWMIQVSQDSLSLEQPVKKTGRAPLIDLIVDEHTLSPPDSADNHLLRTKLEEALSTLTPREVRILRLRFGLEDGCHYTLREVGQIFGLTRERIRQIQKEALDKLNQSSYCGELREFLG
jgi:RNA polymerase primary sigma factor